MRKILLSIFIITTVLLVSTSLHAELPASKAATPSTTKPEIYHYASNTAEYSVGLLEAPTVNTIWGNEKNIPYLGKVLTREAIGERAFFRRVDPQTEESFDVIITTLRADQKFLDSLTEEKTTNLVKNDYKGLLLSGRKIAHVVGNNPKLRRTSLTGFAVDESNNPLYYVTHFLTGENSITAIRVQYSLDNKTFAKYYQMLLNNINYLPQ